MDFTAGLAIGVLCGLVAGMFAADAIMEKGKRDRGELTPRERYELARAAHAGDMQLTPRERDEVLYRRNNPGERFYMPPSYQPPVIVLAAPRAGATVEQPARSTAVTRR